MTRVKNLTAIVLVGVTVFGCMNARGNRRDGRPMVGRVSDLRSLVGKEVALVGTARAGGADGASIELMGGMVELPAYAWPEDYIGHRVTVSGIVVDWNAESEGGKRVYRLGEIQTVSRWSR